MPEHTEQMEDHHDEGLGENAAAMRALVAGTAEGSVEVDAGPKPGSAEAYLDDLAEGLMNPSLQENLKKTAIYFEGRDRFWDQPDSEAPGWDEPTEEKLRATISEVVGGADKYLSTGNENGRSDTLADVLIDSEFGQVTADVVFSILGVTGQSGEPVPDALQPKRFIDTAYETNVAGQEVHTWEHNRIGDIVPEDASSPADRTPGTRMKIYMVDHRSAQF